MDCLYHDYKALSIVPSAGTNRLERTVSVIRGVYAKLFAAFFIAPEICLCYNLTAGATPAAGSIPFVVGTPLRSNSPRLPRSRRWRSCGIRRVLQTIGRLARCIP